MTHRSNQLVGSIWVLHYRHQGEQRQNAKSGGVNRE